MDQAFRASIASTWGRWAAQLQLEPTRAHHERMMYFTNVGGLGRVRYHQIPRSIAVLKTLHDGMPIGMASEIGPTDDGLAAWSLHVDHADVPGRWIIIDRKFVALPAEPV